VADDVPTISTSRLPATEIARRSFGTTRRGFDPEEVRPFLEAVARELLAAERREQELLHELADAEERARHPVIDEAVLTSALGQRSAAVLRNAHEEAARISQRAEEAASTLAHEVQQQATETAVRAESAAAERIAEAELAANALRQQARDEATAVLEAARTEGESIVERAREHGRAMLEQAQEARRRVLADVGHRRRAVTDQIEQFRAARDEVAASVLGVRNELDRIVDDLGRADDAARAAATDAARRQGAAVPDSVLVDEADRAAAELGLDTGAAVTLDLLGPGTPEAGPVTAGLLEGAPADGDPADGGPADGDPADGDPADGGPADGGPAGTAPGWRTAEGRAGGRRQGEAMLRFDDIVTSAGEPSSVGGPPPEDREAPGRTPDDEAAHPSDVEGLFARLRATHAEAEATPVQAVVAGGNEEVASAEPDADGEPKAAAAPHDPAVPVADAGIGAGAGPDGAGAGPDGTGAGPDGAGAGSPASVAQGMTVAHHTAPGLDSAANGGDIVSSEAVPTTAESAALARRAEVLAPIVTNMARRLKRALQDDQNRLLDRLRKGTGEWSDDLLLDEQVQRALYVKASSGLLRDSVAAGIGFARAASGGRHGRPPSPHAQTVDAVTGELAGTVVMLLRRRLEGTDVPDAAERIGAAYREWRGERIERLAEDRVIEAFSAGVLAGAGRGVPLRWVGSDAGPGCADCEDNALAGPIDAGEEFPTGHRYPPAHAGCRCLVMPTPA
jgi:DivIVA domain-containing protein